MSQSVYTDCNDVNRNTRSSSRIWLLRRSGQLLKDVFPQRYARVQAASDAPVQADAGSAARPLH
jgi:hypothetical protein